MNESAWTPANLGEVTAESRKRAGVDSAFLERTVYGVDRSVGLNPVAKYTANNLERYKLIEQGMFAYNPMRLNIGSIGYCSQDFQPGLVSPDYVVFECNPKKLDPDFLNYYINSPAWIEWTAKAGVGSVRMRIYYKELARLPILLPPVAEQCAIADVLSKLDDTIELNRHMNATLDSIARAVFRQWFVENEDVGKWEVRKLSEICSTQYGFTASASDELVGPKFLRITDMNKEPWIEWDNVPYCKIGEEELRKYKLEIGDILVSRMADPGKAGIVEEEVNAVFASYLVRLKFKNLAWAYFSYYFLRSDSYLEYTNGAKSGSVQSGMNARVITDVELPIPSNEKVLSFLEIIKPFRNMIVANLKESRTLARLRDSLLPKLMRGEVRVSEL
jgi:type I restriction enzyme, S subunit